MSDIKVKVESEQVLAALRTLIHNAKVMLPVYDTIGRKLVNRSRMAYRTGTSPNGAPWTKLKTRKGQPLRDTGRMLRSMTHVAMADGVDIGTNVAYAPYHQFGTDKGIPPRPFLPVDSMPPPWAKDIFESITGHLNKGINA